MPNSVSAHPFQTTWQTRCLRSARRSYLDRDDVSVPVKARPDFVLAFPGGRGTADMVRKALAAGVVVRRAG
jgi:hypothetical protein